MVATFLIGAALVATPIIWVLHEAMAAYRERGRED